MEKAEAGNYKFICFTDEGCKLMKKLQAQNNSKVSSLSEWTSDNFKQGNILVFIGATGIAVRAIAPFCRDKTTDPGVIVIDEKGSFVIPILSGHIGGAVKAAKELATYIGATPVLTTATDVREVFAVDVFARENDLGINDMKLAKRFTAELLAGEDVSFTVTPKTGRGDELCLIPKCTVVGIGCRRGKTFDELNEFLKETLSRLDIDLRSLKAIVSVDKKKDEKGILELADHYKIPFITYSADTLMQQTGDFEHSDMVMEVTGADNVCERAVAAYGCSKVVQKKLAKDGMTISVGMTNVRICS